MISALLWPVTSQPQTPPPEGPSNEQAAAAEKQHDQGAIQGFVASIRRAVDQWQSPITCNYCEESSEKRKEHREEEDLKAQIAMADYAFGILLLTVGQAFLGLIGLVLVGFTLKYTRDAAKAGNRNARAAVRAAAAAEASVEAQQRVGEAQTRAYVQITRVHAAMRQHDGAGYGIAPEISIEVTNTGNSPALGFQWDAITTYGFDAVEPLARGNKGFEEMPGWGSDIPRGNFAAKSHNLPSYLRGPEVSVFENGKLHMLVTIFSSFTDVFGKKLTHEDHFAGHFPTGELGQTIQLHRWPASVNEMATAVSMSRKMAQQSREETSN